MKLMNDNTKAEEILRTAGITQRYAFLTLDGILSIEPCPDVEGMPPRIMRFIRSTHGKTIADNVGRCRAYEVTPMFHCGFRIYQEVDEEPLNEPAPGKVKGV